MKLRIILFLLLSSIGFSQQKKINAEYNYIDNYYQYVYRAHYEYLNGNYQKAYDLLKIAESNCPLLNQTGIYEPRILAECAVSLNKPKEAIKYLEILVKDFGFKFEGLKNDSLFFSLQKNKHWKKLEKNAPKYYKEYFSRVDFNLRKELHQMNNEDQSVRGKDFNYDIAKITDSINQEKLKKIVSDCDCFPYYGINKIGVYDVDEFDPDIHTLIMHINIENAEYWKPIFLDLIRRGRAPADLYGSLVDNILRINGVFDYGIYQNVGPELINDYENLDRRRVAVGLPTRKYQDFIYDYWDKVFKKYQKQNDN